MTWDDVPIGSIIVACIGGLGSITWFFARRAIGKLDVLNAKADKAAKMADAVEVHILPHFTEMGPEGFHETLPTQVRGVRRDMSRLREEMTADMTGLREDLTTHMAEEEKRDVERAGKMDELLDELRRPTETS